MRTFLVISLGKIIRRLTRLTGGGGSALAGLIVERLEPSFLTRQLQPMAGSVIMVIGTNGKTTTTKVIADLLRSQGKRVLTNSTGSNFTRGITAEIVAQYQLRKHQLPFDVAVLELDEAYALDFIKKVIPDYVVALNVMRDQLDRYGELSYTLELIATVLRSAKTACIMNANEPAFVDLAPTLMAEVHFYGAVENLEHFFPTDKQLLASKKNPPIHTLPPLHVALEAFTANTATYVFNDQTYQAEPLIRGQYNYHNMGAALALSTTYAPEVPVAQWIDNLKTITPPFGRGETVSTAMGDVEIILVKNPAGFQQVLAADYKQAPVMIAINDNPADGRDVSWLWDVSFEGRFNSVEITSGTRSIDMAVRLQYDNIATSQIITSLDEAVDTLLALPGDHKRIFSTYTAMLAIRKHLRQYSKLEILA